VLRIAFGVALRGIDVRAHAKQLYRTIPAGHQHDDHLGRGVDGFLVAEQHSKLRW